MRTSPIFLFGSSEIERRRLVGHGPFFFSVYAFALVVFPFATTADRV